MDFLTLGEWSVPIGLREAVDILLVALLCYLGLSWLKRYASRTFLAAAILILALYGLARLFDLYLTSLLFQFGAIVILVAMLIIFQEDLRRAAEQFAFRRTAGGAPLTAPSSVDLVVETAQQMAEQRVGALLVFPGRERLDRLLRGGEALGGALSRSLLLSIFHPASPGHDGAAVIEGGVLVRFAVHLPLSRFPDKVGREGTRHSAALGLAENSDALVVVVSEERGAISVAHRGVLEEVDAAELKARLDRFLAATAPKPPDEALGRWMVRDPALKVTSLLLAVLLWLGLAQGVETVRRQYPAPIEYRNLPAGWMVEETSPVEVRVTLVGSEREFERFDPSQLAISLDLGQPRNGPVDYPIAEHQVLGAGDLEVSDIDPNSIRINAYRVGVYVLPVRVPVRNDPPQGIKLARVEAQPAQVRVRAPRAMEGELDAIETEPIDLSRLRGTTRVRLHPNLPPHVHLAEGQPASIEATVFLERTDADGKSDADSDP